MTLTPDLLARFERTYSPVTIPQLEAASDLRADGLSYTAIEAVMRRYHGADYPASRWRDWMRRMGHPPSREWNGGGVAARGGATRV